MRQDDGAEFISASSGTASSPYIRDGGSLTLDRDETEHESTLRIAECFFTKHIIQSCKKQDFFDEFRIL
ncbi:hypothetical protein [Selenomonas sp. oral taxon 126]|uniref:hypothetical protein n=1 Tax=Selenomonas sp. oral taxon 126 TaxID=712528 RepID=UPI001C12AA41|nr:hypothetical protein [Selenomonas sp. oral taxon 126]